MERLGGGGARAEEGGVAVVVIEVGAELIEAADEGRGGLESGGWGETGIGGADFSSILTEEQLQASSLASQFS